jgi:flavodoxin
MEVLMKILVAYFTRTGNNRLVAEELASRLGADLEEIQSKTGYSGPFALPKMIFHMVRKKMPKIKPLKKKPADYDLTVFCAPVWAGHLSAPARSFLGKYGKSAKKLITLWVCGGAENHNPEAYKEAAELIGRKPDAELELETKFLLPEADRKNAKMVMAVQLKKSHLENEYKNKMIEIVKTIKSKARSK